GRPRRGRTVRTIRPGSVASSSRRYATDRFLPKPDAGEAHVKMVYVLFAAVAAGALIGGARSLAGSPAPTPAAEPLSEPVAAAEAPPPGPAPADVESTTVEGEVLEAIDVPSYSYLRVGAKGSEGTWIAVPTASLKVGDHVRLENGMKMTSFAS